jgi:hypothetical protein
MRNESSFEQTLVEVWRQVLVENARVVELGTDRYPVRLTPTRHLREVDFVLSGNTIREFLGVEGVLQNQDNVISIKAARMMPIAISAAQTQSHPFN